LSRISELRRLDPAARPCAASTSLPRTPALPSAMQRGNQLRAQLYDTHRGRPAKAPPGGKSEKVGFAVAAEPLGCHGRVWRARRSKKNQGDQLVTNRNQPPPKRRRARRKAVDPRAVLEEIAADPNASSALRYRAASRLLAIEQREAAASRRVGPAANGAGADEDPITRRALEIAAARNSRIN
jgi:hypothetical protein